MTSNYDALVVGARVEAAGFHRPSRCAAPPSAGAPIQGSPLEW